MTQQSDDYKIGFNDALKYVDRYCQPIGLVHTPEDINELRIAIENAPNSIIAVCMTTNFLHKKIEDLKL